MRKGGVMGGEDAMKTFSFFLSGPITYTLP